MDQNAAQGVGERVQIARQGDGPGGLELPDNHTFGS